MKTTPRKNSTLPRPLAVFLQCLRIAAANALAYRANLVMTTLIILTGNILFPLVTILIYNSGASFPGWTFHETLLIQALFTLSSGLAGTFFSAIFWVTNNHIREGSFEIALLKPLGTAFWITCSSISPENLGTVAGGLAMAIYALANTGLPDLTGLLGALALFTGGLCVQFGFSMIMAATSFIWVGNSRIPEIADSILSFGKYPLATFPAPARAIMTFILPVGLVAFYPASALLGQIHAWHFTALLPCLAFAAFGLWLYGYMIRRYEGVGG